MLTELGCGGRKRDFCIIQLYVSYTRGVARGGLYRRAWGRYPCLMDLSGVKVADTEREGGFRWRVRPEATYTFICYVSLLLLRPMDSNSLG